MSQTLRFAHRVAHEMSLWQITERYGYVRTAQVSDVDTPHATHMSG